MTLSIGCYSLCVLQVVPHRGLFEVSERTRNIFSLPAFEQPPQNKSKLIKTVSQYEEDEEECDSGPSQTSSSSSLELDIPMFSGGLVDEGEGEGEIAELTDEKSNVVLMHSEVARSRASAWRNSRLVEEVDLGMEVWIIEFVSLSYRVWNWSLLIWEDLVMMIKSIHMSTFLN